MNNGIMASLTPKEYAELLQRVGTAILNLPIASAGLGHTSPVSTIRGNYFAHAPGESRIQRLSIEFVNEALHA